MLTENWKIYQSHLSNKLILKAASFPHKFLHVEEKSRKSLKDAAKRNLKLSPPKKIRKTDARKNKPSPVPFGVTFIDLHKNSRDKQEQFHEQCVSNDSNITEVSTYYLKNYEIYQTCDYTTKQKPF